MGRRLISFHAMEVQHVEDTVLKLDGELSSVLVKALDEDGAQLMFRSTELLSRGNRIHVTIEVDDSVSADFSMPPDPDHETSPYASYADAQLVAYLKRITDDEQKGGT